MAVKLSELIDNRLLSTKKLLVAESENIITSTTEEIKAVNGFENRADDSLSTLEKSYLADLVAVSVLQYSLDHFKEEEKSISGPDAISHESQDKLQFIQDMIERYGKDAALKAVKLGLGPAGGTNSNGPLVGNVPLITKIRAGRH